MPDSSQDEESDSVASEPTSAALTQTTAQSGVPDHIKLAARVLFGIVVILLLVIIILVVLPLATEVAEEDTLGVAYTLVLRVNLLNFVALIIDVILLVVALKALWDKDLSRLRKLMFWCCVAGIALSLALYSELTIPEDIGQNLWQGEGSPDYDEFMSYLNSFVLGSITLFAAVILGIIGANYKDFIKAIVPWG